MEDFTRKPEAVDRAIMALRDADPLSEGLDKFCTALLDWMEVDHKCETDCPLEEVIGLTWTFDQKRFIACCLLRILDYKPEVFDASNLRAKSFVIFDEAFQGAVYHRLEIDVNEQNHTKLQKLRGKITEQYQLTVKIADSLGDLTKTHDMREKFMRNIRSKYSKTLLQPFLPSDLIEIDLDKIFKSVDDYLSDIDQSETDKYQHCRQDLEEFVSSAGEHKTFYSKGILVRLGNKLLTLLEQHFHSNPMNKPASLSIRSFEKKYPLHRPKETFNLIVSIVNKGEGVAHGVELVIAEATETNIDNQRQWVGTIGPQKTRQVQFMATVSEEVDAIIAKIELHFTDSDGTTRHEEEMLEFEAQKKDVDWSLHEDEQSYSLEPVTDAAAFIGRGELLSKLESIICSKTSVGSAFIHGQKRVGKTSLANTLASRVKAKDRKDLITIYIEAGEYIDTDPIVTTCNLGNRIVRGLKEDRRLQNLPSPKFSSALSPLSDFVKEINRQLPDLRILIILDEFDELPIDLYKRGSRGDALFLTIRAMSGSNHLGFLLVGAESMDYVISSQGDRLNKFRPMRVDYFDKEMDWSDFVDLVRSPVEPWLEITDQAIDLIYEETAGNPYFTILLCQELERLMLERRDCHATPVEVREAIRICLRQTKSNAFQHFWDDKIPQAGSDKEITSVNRRKFLLAFGEARRRMAKVTLHHLTRYCDEYGLSAVEVENLEREFIERRIITKQGEAYKCRVNFFETWLSENGPSEIITQLLDRDNILKKKEEQERSRVTSTEIGELVREKNMVFKGEDVAEEKIRAWLTQFGDNVDQRFAFKILRGLNYYSGRRIRQKLAEAHSIASTGLVFKRKGAQRKRDDLIVSYIDDIAKSGAHLARLYADHNNIYKDNVVAKNDIGKALLERTRSSDAVGLVFVDDLIGSGNNACAYFRELNSLHGTQLASLTSEQDDSGARCKLRIYFVAITGFAEGTAKVRECIEDLRLPISVHVCDPLSNSDKVFDEVSNIFPDASERERARQCIAEMGGHLEKKWPLGYRNCELSLVFEHNCPNNSLPILFKKTKDFVPLFPR